MPNKQEQPTVAELQAQIAALQAAPKQPMGGSGFTMRQDGTKITIVFDASKDLRLSSSGKNMLIATTGGNSKLLIGNRTVNIGLNVYTPAE